MSLGLEWAGFTVRWQVERDPYCENILARHWPDVVRRQDVRFAGAANLERVDLIAGGFPCQDISAAGKGHGITGRRSGLWREFSRIIRELRPRWVLIENVPALRNRGADTVLRDLEEAGYTCSPLVVGARHVGAPHRRDRVWILAHTTQFAEREPHDAAGTHAREESRASAGRGGAGVAHADMEGSCAEWGGGLLDGERQAHGHDAHRFPARCGEPQWAWEHPRTIESPLGRTAHGISVRLARARWRRELMALGNAVVPQVVEVIGRAILAVDA